MSNPELELYLLQRRGEYAGQPERKGCDRAMIVGAISEAHARVACYERCKDIAWADPRFTTIRTIMKDEGVMHTIYTPFGFSK